MHCNSQLWRRLSALRAVRGGSWSYLPLLVQAIVDGEEELGQNEFVWFNFGFGIFEAVPVITFALGCHLQAPPVHSELINPVPVRACDVNVFIHSNGVIVLYRDLICLFTNDSASVGTISNGGFVDVSYVCDALFVYW